MTINRNKQPRINPVENLHASAPVKRYLSNKIPVHIIEAGDQEILRIDLIFQAGSRYQKKIFQASFSNALTILRVFFVGINMPTVRKYFPFVMREKFQLELLCSLSM